jgi:predicted metalloprotease with PDZ domain
MIFFMQTARTLTMATLALAASTALAQSGTPIQLHIDLTDAARNLIHVTETLPVHAGENTFEYPQWIQGDHRPNGPIDAVTGVFFKADGKDLPWRRDLIDMYAFHVTVPKGVSSVDLAFDFLAVPGGFGSSTYRALSPNLVVLEMSSTVMYPANTPVHDIPVVCSLHLPADWHYGSALRTSSGDVDGSGAGPDVTFEKVSIEQLVDSPIITGRFFKQYALAPEISPKHFIDIGADAADDVDVKPEIIEKYSQLVREASALYKSHHYDHYNFVLSLSDEIRGEGLEHHQSSDNGVEEDYLSNPVLFSLEPDLLPHEFTHSWNGKYRRPIGLATPDYHTPMKDDLLWVYEGMTQYWGTVLAERSGLETRQAYMDELAMTAARLNDGTPGRIWRNVQDTADASQILRGGSPNWSNWRRGQDYYTEGLLIWLDADTTIRQLTHNQKSLNDFAALFLGKGGNTTWKVVPYNFDDVVKDLNEIAPYDWRGFLTERLDDHNPHAPLGGIEHGGYKLVYTDKPSDLEKVLLHSPYGGGVDVRYSLGLSPAKDGTLSDVLFFSPAFKAGFAPGDKIVAVNGHSYSPTVLMQAVKDAKTSTAPIEFITTRRGEYIVRKIDYHDGEKYPHLERVDGTPDLLGDILKPMVPVRTAATATGADGALPAASTPAPAAK